MSRNWVARTHSVMPQGDWDWVGAVSCVGDQVYAVVHNLWYFGDDALATNDGQDVNEDWATVIFHMIPEHPVQLTRGIFPMYSGDESNINTHPDGYGPGTTIGFGGQFGFYVTSDWQRYIYIYQENLFAVRRFDTLTLEVKTIAGSGFGEWGHFDAPVGRDALFDLVMAPTCVPELGYLYCWDGSGPDMVGTGVRGPFIRRVSLTEPYPVDTIYDPSDHDRYDSGWDVSWLREINPSTGMPRQLDPDVLAVTSGRFAYHDGYLYWLEWPDPRLYLEDKIPVSENGWWGAIRRWQLDDEGLLVGDIETLLVYRPEAWTDRERSWSTQIQLRLDSVSEGVATFVDDVRESAQYVVRVGDKFHALGPIEVMDISSSAVTVRYVGPSGNPREAVTIGLGQQWVVYPDWYGAAGKLDQPGPYFHHLEPAGESSRLIIVGGKYLGVVNWMVSELDSSPPTGGNAMYPNRLVLFDLAALVENKPVDFDPTNPCYQYVYNWHPWHLRPPHSPYGAENQGWTDGFAPRGFFIPADGVDSPNDPASPFYGKIVFYTPEVFTSLNEGTHEGSVVVRVLEEADDFEIEFDLSFEGSALQAYQAVKAIPIHKDLGRLELT